MNHREKIEHAIQALEAERHVLGNTVVDVTVMALREALVPLMQPGAAARDKTGVSLQPPAGQVKTGIMLTAQVTGLDQVTSTSVANGLPALTNDLWQQLAEIIQQEGGNVESYSGHVLTAFFARAQTDKDAPIRAVRAALAMQALFRNFAAQLDERRAGFKPHLPAEAAANEVVQNQPLPPPSFHLYIGLNDGSLQVNEPRKNGTAVTDEAVKLSHQLVAHQLVAQTLTNEMGQSGGIYITSAINRRIADHFDVDPVPFASVQAGSDTLPVYRVLGLQPRLLDLSGWGVASVETALVGREEILDQLRRLLADVSHGSGKMVTIIGEAGMGKSRLAFEFGEWARQQSPDILILRARTEQGIRPFPYALARDLLSTTLNIQDDEPAALVIEKLIAILRRLQITESNLRQQAELLGQLVGLGVVNEAMAGDPVDLQATEGHASYLREHAFSAWASLVQHTAHRRQATLIFLEDIHEADVESLHLLAHVSQILAQAPVLLVCLARPTLYDRWLDWPRLDYAHTLAVPHTRLDLPPLSAADCRRLIHNILHRVPHLPEGLVELIISQADGNPFYVEELVKTLIDDGLITVGEEGWQVQVQQLPRLRIPATLTAVLQARLNSLPLLKRTLLQRASVMGHTFWETAVLAMNDSVDKSHTLDESRAALLGLEERGLIFRQATSTFTGAGAYMFKHNLLQQVAYESILLRQRPLYHKQVADWLSAQSGERVAEYAGKIAAHYDLAGEAVMAAGLYEMAGRRAQDMADLEVAIDNYRKTLALLIDKPRHSLWLLRLQEEIGPLLLRRLRLVEAVQVYMAMQYTAEIDGELSLQAKAWLGQAAAQREQSSYLAMLHAAQHAAKAARLVTAQVEEANALLRQSEAYIYLGRLSLAQEQAQEALLLCEQVSLLPEQAVALGLLCQIHKSQGEMTRAASLRQQLEHLAEALDASMSAHKILALYHLVLAGTYQAWGDLALARSSLEAAQALYHSLDNQLALAQTQAALGKLAQQQNKGDEAVAYLYQAVALAKMIGDEYGRIRYQLCLARTLLSRGQTEEVENILTWLLDHINNPHLMVDWWGKLDVYELLVQFYLYRQEPDLALNMARQAYTLAKKRERQRDIAVSWRLLGQSLQALCPQMTTITVDQQRYDVTGCFARSWQHLEMANAQVPGYRRQALQTLQAWRNYEAEQMQPQELQAAFAEREAAIDAAPTWDELYLPRL
jgi:predicted ATPase/class 3 adenylate cyclase